jgi:50S ribosomal subunit-associated GTPase HflX
VGDIAYIQLKQLEEAELLVVSKADRLSARQRSTILGELEKAYSGREVRFISSKTGEGVDELLESLLEVPADRKSHAAMEVDYDRYARGEAQLGWYNAEVAWRGG